MTSKFNQNDLPKIGTPSFTPLLLRHITTHPGLTGWSINPSLFSILLLSLIVRKGGVIVDCTKKDVDNVGRVINDMIRSIFDLSIHHLSLDEYVQPEDLNHKLLHDHSNTNPFSTNNDNIADGERNGNSAVNQDVLIITGLENASSPVKVKICDSLTKKRIQVLTQHSDLRDIPGEGSGGQKIERRYGPLVIWIREEGREVPSWVVDQFMLSTHVDSDDLEFPPSDLEDGVIIPNSYLSTLSSLLPYIHIHAPLQIHISNLLSAISSHPYLKSSITGKVVRTFPEYIKAHRILSGSFQIPYSFLNPEAPSSDDQVSDEGLGGGIGGVNTWAKLAGEEPTLTKFQSETEIANGGIEDIYCTPINVEGVFKVVVKHRCKKREERGQVMWLIKGSAGDGDLSKMNGKEKKMMKSGHGSGVDKILDEILRTV